MTNGRENVTLDVVYVCVCALGNIRHFIFAKLKMKEKIEMDSREWWTWLETFGG